jgi:hypothetical protein
MGRRLQPGSVENARPRPIDFLRCCVYPAALLYVKVDDIR